MIHVLTRQVLLTTKTISIEPLLAKIDHLAGQISQRNFDAAVFS